MKNEHLGADHVWACRQTGGQLGEIINFTLLSAPQVEAITSDPVKVKDVCPGGEVVCNTCEAPFAGGEPAQAAPIDFKALGGQLVAPASGKQS